MARRSAAQRAARAASPDPRRVAAVRRFNRLYTQRIGLLRRQWLDSEFSLPEARVLYELWQGNAATAAELCRLLGLDPGYASRILREFRRRGFVTAAAFPDDARRMILTLTPRGRKAFAPLEARSQSEAAVMLEGFGPSDQRRLVSAMQTIEALLAPSAQRAAPYILRPPAPGDLGWVVSRHGAVYAREYGWDEHLEGLCAEIVADFVRNHDAKRERCWIAEKDGENVGCVFLVKDSLRVARLRLLLVEQHARGLGIGARLTDECIQFARQAGYRKITLWTHSVLTAARQIYERAGFRLVDSEPHHSFGRKVVGETWDMTL